MMIVLTDNTEKLYADCVKLNGMTSQIRQYYEELGEATVAMAKYQRMLEWGSTEEIEQARKDLLGEIADNIIMQTQFAYIFGIDEITDIIKYKLNRQQNRIDKKKEKLQNGY